MSEETFYRKVGRKYVPFAQYDREWTDAFTKGSHLVVVKPGSTSRVYNIDPAFAPMIAAGMFASDAIANEIVKASEIRLSSESRKTPLTQEQLDAWNHLIDVLGPGAKQLEWASAREVAEAGVKSMQEQASKMLTNPAVKKAWEYFLTMCELAKDDQS